MYQLPEIKPRKKPRAPYKKPEAVKELERLAFEAACADHPNVPRNVIAPRIFRDDTAGGLSKCVVADITLKGGFATRVNSMGVYRASLKKFTFSGQKKGVGDVIGTYKGLSIQVEIKIGRDQQSEHQKKVQQEHEAAGGLYYLARNFTDFKTWFDSL